jgi:addiction module HigA family antidote
MHPGRILLEDYLAPRGISVFHLAKELGVSPMRLYQIVQGERSITPTMALRFAHYFGLSKRFWLAFRLDMTRKLKHRSHQGSQPGAIRSAA